MKKLYLSIICLLHLFIGISQELPPILKYNTGTYNAGNQNWMATQDVNGYMYFANNEGLLEFNGFNWTLYPTPNETILRSVKAIDNRIYTGFYMDFGYWERQPDGVLAYTSLTSKIKDKIFDDEQFWNIERYDQWVIFQSLSQIFIYNTKSKEFNIIGSDTGMNKVFRVNNTIFYQTYNSGLYEIENGKSKLISDTQLFKKSKIINIYSRDDALLIQTQYEGFYIYKNGIATKWDIPANDELTKTSTYSGEALSNGGFAVGTVSNGIFILSSKGEVKYHITQNKGLSNNTALSLFEDRDSNLWVGLDNGINCINTQSAVHSFVDDTGFLGTVYTSVMFKNILYIGTNQGLFYKPFKSKDEFKFIPGTKGQVWSLFEYDNTLFCGHDYGTFIVENNTVKTINVDIGTWKFTTIPNHPDLLLQGTYFGVSVLEKTASGWKFRNHIEGFEYSSRYLEMPEEDTNSIYIGHEYKGVFRISVNNEYTKVLKTDTYKTPSKGRNVSLAKFNKDIYFASKEGFFKLDPKTKKFNKQELISGILQDGEYTSGKLMVDKNNRMWFFTKNYINYFICGKLNTELKHNVIPIPSSITNSMLGYENITQITPSIFLVGTTDGYYTINLNELKFKTYKVYLTGINYGTDTAIKNSTLNKVGNYDPKENNFTFNYTVPEYSKYVNAEFQYKLEGDHNDWSEWSNSPSVSFKSLPPGEYVFKVRAKTGNSISSNIASYSFIIAKPWYATTLAFIIYLIFAVIAAFLVNKAYKNYYHRQKEKLIEENNRLLEIKQLENEQELMKIKNVQLQQEFENKNRELAVSTMNLIKKNELLSMIKDNLVKNNDNGEKSIKPVISLINKNINEDDTWDMFKEAFNNADKDFLKKIKKTHPLLTPNDLRLCAYLRLNLSSKEIAPLLNISVRSVEIKRYRLRKKMELPHELGLVEYILSV
ncbi:helix-turn-helix and ligand-binding sensor domain-containing protein [Flavobacterium rhizosphaerae]|uniref:Triple tyrosine motif-containing protein n=1 Tax=Flavobacterium rhizosphaerae TaxID=3163298 RepID=A0ABW8YUJ0_9FLAO